MSTSLREQKGPLVGPFFLLLKPNSLGKSGLDGFSAFQLPMIQITRDIAPFPSISGRTVGDQT
jgi:hypothetical protein